MDQASQSFSFTGGMINTQLMILRGDSSHNKQGVFKYLKHVDLVLENDHADSNYFDILYTLTEMEFIKHKDIHVQLWVGICFQKLLARLRSKTDHCDKEKLQLILEFLIDNTKGVNSSNESLYKYSLLFVERLSSAETLCTCSSLPDAAVTNISCILFYTAFQLINENNWISIFSSLLNILVRFAHQVLSLHDVTPVLDIIYVNIIKPSRKERPFVAKFTSNLILACAHILELPTQEFLQSCLVGKILPKDSLVSEGKLDLIGQLHKICPWLVATVWGPLRNILKERDSPDRPQTLLLLAKMFCKSQSNYITQHYSTWRVFLDSLLIGSASDNALVVQFAKEFLSVQQNKCMQKQFIELYLVPVVNRGDENLVLDGMSAIVELLQTNTQLFTENTDLLEILVTVSREGKEFEQREAAMSSLGQLFYHFYQHLEDNCAPDLDKKVMWILAAVLEQYKLTTGKERLAVEKVFLHHFIPIKLLTEERMKRLLSIWLSLESCHYDIIRDMMVSSYWYSEKEMRAVRQKWKSEREALQREVMRLTSENLDLREKNELQREQIKNLTKIPMHAEVMEADAGPSTASKYKGMFEYRTEDEQIIVRHLIHDLKPHITLTLPPGLPSYILFMCIRHTDFINDAEKFHALMFATINAVKEVTKHRLEDLETTVLWLSNTLHLVNIMKQYSGDKTFQAENTPKQNEQCLKNFDLSDYRQVLSDIALWIHEGVICELEERILPIVVPAILEHEAVPSLRGEIESTVDIQKIFYFICANSLNKLLLSKELCNWSKGIHIRYNLSYLELWVRDHLTQNTNVLDTLQPMIQAAHLLQANKQTENDAKHICDTCDKLSMAQITKILNLFASAEDLEPVLVAFIRKVQTALHERTELQEQKWPCRT